MWRTPSGASSSRPSSARRAGETRPAASSAELMADAGVAWIGRDADATPVTVALPADGDRALVTVMPAAAVDLETLAGITARAIVVDLPSAPVAVPPPPVGLRRRRRSRGRVLDGRPAASSLDDLHALILNEREVRGLTGRADVLRGGRHLAALGTTVVVTRGAVGAIAIEPDGRTVDVAPSPADVGDRPAPATCSRPPTSGRTSPASRLEERLRLATSYASLSLGRATDRQKGITLRVRRSDGS